jgi:hypothetical protein
MKDQNETTTIDVEATKISSEIETTIAPARNINIVDQETANAANKLRTAIKAKKKDVEAFFKPHIENAHKAHKDLTTSRKEKLQPLDAAIKFIGNKLNIYDQEQQRIAKEAEAKRQQEETEARRIAEEEAEKIRQAEQKRIEEEQLAAAQQAEESGDNALAEAILEQEVEVAPFQPAYVPPPQPVQPAYVPPTGMSRRTTWKAEVMDIKALCVAVAAGDVPADVFKINQSLLNEKARAMQNNLNWPGVRTYPDSNII